MTLWTDELSERVAKDREWHTPPADVVTWVFITVVPLLLAGAIGVMLWAL
jgi:hypothetical protein